jgi:hypothetical protein
MLALTLSCADPDAFHTLLWGQERHGCYYAVPSQPPESSLFYHICRLWQRRPASYWLRMILAWQWRCGILWTL